MLPIPELFEIFDFPFVRGNPKTAFPNPNAIAITESAAKRLFGDEDPMGKTITADSNHHGGERTITAVLKDVPHNSTLQFDYVSTGGFTSPGAKYVWENWIPTDGWRPVNTYFLLREGVDLKGLSAKLPEFIDRYMGAEIARTNAYHLQPLNRIYLYSRQDYNLDWYFGDIDRVYQFGAIAFLVLCDWMYQFHKFDYGSIGSQGARGGFAKGIRGVSLTTDGAVFGRVCSHFIGCTCSRACCCQIRASRV